MHYLFILFLIFNYLVITFVIEVVNSYKDNKETQLHLDLIIKRIIQLFYSCFKEVV